jgi:hypothetical protein
MQKESGLVSTEEPSTQLAPGEYDVYLEYLYWLFAKPASDGTPVPRASHSRRSMDRVIVRSSPSKLAVEKRSAKPAMAPTAPPAFELQAKATAFVLGKLVAMEFKHYNLTDECRDTYNPFLSPLVSRRAVELLILDRNGRRLGDLAEFDGGSSRTVNEDDWITIPPGGFIATPLSFVAGRVPFSTESLPPGKYAIRLMVHDGFSAGDQMT